MVRPFRLAVASGVGVAEATARRKGLPNTFDYDPNENTSGGKYELHKSVLHRCIGFPTCGKAPASQFSLRWFGGFRMDENSMLERSPD